MKRQAAVGLSSVVGIFFVTSWLAAHHSGNYDSKHPVTLSGTVTKYEMVNPHSRIYLETKDQRGNTVSWVVVSAPPQRLYRAGWRKNTLKAGDRITLTGAPARDGSKEMRMLKVITPDGRTLLEGSE